MKKKKKDLNEQPQGATVKAEKITEGKDRIGHNGIELNRIFILKVTCNKYLI